MTATTTPISRSITKSVLSKEQTEGVGARVRRSIGCPEIRNLDPFLLLSVPKNGGFPDHPHRDFETVTYMLDGQTHHKDFAGHKGTIGPEDLQWMTAGPQDGVVIKVIAGDSHRLKFQIYTHIPTMFLDFKMDMNQTVTQTILATYSGFIYILSGTAYIGDPKSETEAKAHHTLIFSEDSTSTVRIQTKDDTAHFVLIAGEPLREPVVQIGPFVMNTREEVYETYRNYRDGVNGFERRRARNSDGTPK
ncbi:hypothetical protein KI688_003589 [Linnemannia hyalina]|uniref:Pirin n=1 Tax=Linnemannia hyalina TaxID=64524 RepID=A0A9P7XNQ0_9FUNG|nr:hypothetical protein KI688_003589 [Linnemannia hyalina]